MEEIEGEDVEEIEGDNRGEMKGDGNPYSASYILKFIIFI